MPLQVFIACFKLEFHRTLSVRLYPTCWDIFVPNHKETCSTLTFQRESTSSFSIASAIKLVSYITSPSKRTKSSGMDFKRWNNCSRAIIVTVTRHLER